MENRTGGCLVGGPYDGEVFDSGEPLARMRAMTYLPEFGIEWHRYDRTPGLFSVADTTRPVLTYQGVEYGESGLTPSNHPWSTQGSDHWREFANQGGVSVIYSVEQ